MSVSIALVRHTNERRETMEARMPNPALILPALKACLPAQISTRQIAGAESR